MDELRFALVGSGPMGADLARSAVGLDGVGMAVAADVDPDAARKLADELGADATADPYVAMRRADVDAVIVATPGSTHADLVVAAFGAGKHVFCEKPMALDPADCRRMIEAGQNAGRKLMIGQVLRYIHVFSYTGDLMQKGALGDVACIRITRTCGGWGGAGRAWRNVMAKSGGVLFEFSVHELDFMMHVAGDVEAVHAFANHTSVEDVDYPDSLVLNLRFASGAIGQLTAGLADRIGCYSGEILGTDGAVHFDAQRGEIRSQSGSDDVATIAFDDLNLENPVGREIREFFDSVRTDSPVTIPGEDGMRVVAVADAAYRSLSEGRIVSLK